MSAFDVVSLLWPRDGLEGLSCNLSLILGVSLMILPDIPKKVLINSNK